MSKHVLDSYPYLKLLSAKPSKFLYKAIIKEAPGYLFKALTECSYNCVFVGSVVSKRKKKIKQQKFLKKLAEKNQTIEQKRKLLLRNIKEKDTIYWLCSACLVVLKKEDGSS